MGRVIRGQVIAGSGADRVGAGFSREAIRHLFTQLADVGIGGVNHDLSQSPIVRAYNFFLVENEDGRLLIKADVEVLNEAKFSRMGGFSISCFGEAYQVGTADSPAIGIILNPAQFEFNVVRQTLAQFVPSGFSVELREKIEKSASLETAIILILVYALGSISQGFFSAAGADLYRWLKGLRRKDHPDGPIELQLHLQLHYPVILKITSGVSPEVFAGIGALWDPPSLPEGVEESDVERIVGNVEPGPRLLLDRVILKDGTEVDLRETGGTSPE